MSTKILIIDDHEGFRHNLRRFLSSLEGDNLVAEAGTAGEGLALAAKEVPEVAIVDINLPDLSGLDVASSIQSRFPRTKVIILTQYDIPEYRTAAARANVYAFVAKIEFVQQLPAVLDSIRRPLEFSGSRAGREDSHYTSYLATAGCAGVLALDSVTATPLELFDVARIKLREISGKARLVEQWLETRSQVRGNSQLWTLVHSMIALLCLEVVVMLLTAKVHTQAEIIFLISTYLIISLAGTADLGSLARSAPRTHQMSVAGGQN